MQRAVDCLHLHCLQFWPNFTICHCILAAQVLPLNEYKLLINLWVSVGKEYCVFVIIFYALLRSPGETGAAGQHSRSEGLPSITEFSWAESPPMPGEFATLWEEMLRKVRVHYATAGQGVESDVKWLLYIWPLGSSNIPGVHLAFRSWSGFDCSETFPVKTNSVTVEEAA